ncbi:hypothetical protein Baya_2065 [Bagarius yarrelli]|uniref:Uncharacterized protein n=1 Tax=Bagarius yarrelli TaxID=175774 RepID=A0A556TMW5_BAGYA|nr:hypothetical protein Baya_2065 [Bagarius yarrelli]
MVLPYSTGLHRSVLGSGCREGALRTSAHTKHRHNRKCQTGVKVGPRPRKEIGDGVYDEWRTTDMFAIMHNLKFCPAGLTLWDYLLSMTCRKLSEEANEGTLDADTAQKEAIVNRYSREDTLGIRYSAVVAGASSGDEF